VDIEPRLREWGGRNAVDGGLSEGRIAERFFVLSTA
jgi:hypothetical protein